jgi:hypothetical protein
MDSKLHKWGVNWEEAYAEKYGDKVRWLYKNAYVTAKTKAEALRIVKANNKSVFARRKWKVYKA